MAGKIATCCYCGTRAALILRSTGRHELSCSSCGAPLHEMKALPMRSAAAPVRAMPAAAARTAPGPKTRRKPVKKRKKMRKFSPMRAFREALDEVWDVVEDTID